METEIQSRNLGVPSDQLIDQVLRRLDDLWREISDIEDVFIDYTFPEVVYLRGRALRLTDMRKTLKEMRGQTRTLQDYGSCT